MHGVGMCNQLAAKEVHAIENILPPLETTLGSIELNVIVSVSLPCKPSIRRVASFTEYQYKIRGVIFMEDDLSGLSTHAGATRLETQLCRRSCASKLRKTKDAKRSDMLLAPQLYISIQKLKGE